MAKTKAHPMEKHAAGPRQARGRFVSRSIATNEQLAGLSLLADFLFRACIPFLDVSGRMTGNPALIKSQVVPLRDEIHSGNLPELLRTLSAATDHEGIPLVFWYEISGIKVLEFPKFKAHQTGLREQREAPSKFPVRNGMEKLLHVAGGGPEELPPFAGGGPAQDEVEVEVEVEGRTTTSSSPRARASGPGADATQNAAATEPADWLGVERVAAKLESDDDRGALRTILGKAPHPPTFLAELDASLEHMAGHAELTPSQAGKALRDFVGNGNCNGPPPPFRVFRRYLELAATEQPIVSRPAASGGQEIRPGDPDYDPDPFVAGLNRAARELAAREEANTHG